jgi:outer membrane protein assembly factor BamB
MLDNVQRLFLLLVCAAVLPGCRAPAPQRERLADLANPQLLSAADISIAWQNQLPLKPEVTRRTWFSERLLTPAEEMKRLTILGDRLYALSDRNYLVSLNRHSGQLVFSRNMAPASFTVKGMDLHGNEIVSVIANRLVEIDPEFGTEKRASEVPYGIVGTAARNTGFFYLSGTDRRMHVMRADDKLRLFEVVASDNSMITSIIAADDFVVFGTDSGKVVAMTPDKPKQLWEFKAADAIAGQIVRHDGAIFAASKDTNIYKLDGSTGELLWKYPAGAILSVEPVVTQGVVYQHAGDKGLAAVDAADGRLLWQLEGGIDLLAVSSGKAYCITEDSQMAVMDNVTGRHVHTINLAGVSVYATNLVDSNIYVSDAAGLVACLKPLK